MVKLDSSKCSGCAACYNVCPSGAISMQANNEGFLYPIIDYKKCINCELCLRKCPLNNENNNIIKQTFYGWVKNDSIRKKCSSGGIFWILSKYVLDNGGVVFGASYNYQTNSVEHMMIDSIKSIWKVAKSKYVQSSIGDTYKKVRENLEANRMVLFCGTPCQVSGLSSYLEKEYTNLIKVDFVCHGVPSPKIWKYHLTNFGNSDVQYNLIDFRDKTKGAVDFSLKISGDNMNYLKSHNHDLFMRLFLDDIILRESCYNCVSKGENRCSDITISDFWGANKYGISNLECKKGVSLFSIYNEKVLNILQNETDLFMQMVDNSLMINKPSFNNSASLSVKRSNFFRGVTSQNYKKVAAKTTRLFIVKKIINRIKRILKIK